MFNIINALKQHIKKSYNLKCSKKPLKFIFKYREYNKYEVKVFDNFSKMYKQLKIKNDKYDRVRLLSSYTRKWISKKDKTVFDFDIDGVKLQWNSNSINWIDSDNAKKLKEIAYYHTIQGFDLNYAGVIIGKDIYLNDKNQIAINEKYVVAKNEKPNKSALSSAEYEWKLKEFVLNRYKVLLTRGARGCYIYIYIYMQKIKN